MRFHESPAIPFTILYEHFLEGQPIVHRAIMLYYNLAPEVIIYDNSCNLHNYCLNREPDFFRNSQFLVDRFHWRNHTG